MRKTFVSILFVLLMSVGSAVLAQEPAPTFCGALSDADCTLLTQSASAMRDVKSAGFQFEMQLNVSDLPGAAPKSFGFRMTGNGSYALDSASLSALLFSPDELAQNMDKLPQMMEDAIRAISADGNFLMFFSDELLSEMATSDTPLPSKAGFSVRLVDGTAYVNLDKLAELDAKNEFPPGWVGFDMAAYYRQLLDQQSGALSQANPLQGFNFSDASVYEKYITIERQADSTLNGEAVAVFKTSVDLDGLFSDEAIQTYLRDQLQQSASSSGLAQKDIDQMVTLVQNLYGGMVIEVTQSVGLDDHYTHQVTMSLNWAFDVNAIAGAFGDTGGSKEPPINIQMSLQADLSQFNSAPPILAPEVATIIPLDQLQNMTNGLGGNFGIPGN